MWKTSEERKRKGVVAASYLSIYLSGRGRVVKRGGKDVGRRWGGEREAGGLIGRKLSARAILRRIRDSPGSYPSVRFRIPRACTSASSSHRRRAARGSHSRDRIAGPSPSSSSSLPRYPYSTRRNEPLAETSSRKFNPRADLRPSAQLLLAREVSVHETYPASTPRKKLIRMRDSRSIHRVGSFLR